MNKEAVTWIPNINICVCSKEETTENKLWTCIKCMANDNKVIYTSYGQVKFLSAKESSS